MKKYLLLSLILLGFNAHAGLEALTIPLTGDSFTLSCLENDTWNTCGDTTHVRAGEYKYVIHTPSTGNSIAIGYIEEGDNNTIVAACRSQNDDNWEDCSPNPQDISFGDYDQNARPANDNNGALMVIGAGENSVIAACRNASGVWYDCSPQTEPENYFSVGSVHYTNNQWIIMDNSLERDYENGITYNLAHCMNPDGNWQTCRMLIPDPDGDFYNSVWGFNQVQYVPASQEWVAIGMGYEDGHGDVFKSICRDDGPHYTYWYDCTGGIFLSSTSERLVQNAKGELLQFNLMLSGVSLVTQTLCKNPNGPWVDCSFDLKQKNQIYSGVTIDGNGNWVLVGYQLSANLSENIAHLTATFAGTQWDTLSQEPMEQTGFIDVMWVD